MDLNEDERRARTTSIIAFSTESRERAIATAREQAESCFSRLRAAWVSRCEPATAPDGASGWEAELAVTFSLT